MSVDLQKVVELAGEIPFDNIENGREVVEIFSTNDIAVVITTKATSITHGTHFHNSYEFVLPYSNVPSNTIDNKIFYRKENSLFAINPMQEHGIKMDLKGFYLCGLHINKELVQSIAASIYGSPNIVFSNESYSNSHDINMLIRLFLEELRYKQQGYEFILDNLSMLITISLIRQIKHNLPSKPHNMHRTNIVNINKAIDFMNENYVTDISCSELAKLVNMDKFGFIRSFKRQTNKTPYEYLLDLKIEKAKKMLRSREYSITEISMMCGFSSHSHFTSTFKKKTGISPSEFREGS